MNESSEVAKYAYAKFLKNLGRMTPEYKEEAADIMLVKVVSFTIGEKLESARNKGRHGWWSTECDTGYLKELLREHVDKGDMRDVINLAAMIYFREVNEIDKP